MRTDPPSSGPELVQLTAFLDFLRETVLLKCEDLTAEQLAQPLPPSSLTLGGLVNHLALVEDWWFRVRFAGLEHVEPWGDVDWDADPDWEFRTAADLSPDQLAQRYRETIARSRDTAVAPLQGPAASLRAVGGSGVLHLIEETARHAGHADLLREAIDGSVGE